MREWRNDAGLERRLAEEFQNPVLQVLRKGNHALIDPTPFGEMLLVSLDDHRSLVCVQAPPAGAPDPGSFPLSAELEAVLRERNLKPWKVFQRSTDLYEDARRLIRNEGDASEQGRGLWSPFLRACPVATTVIGEARNGVVDNVTALLRAAGPDSPVPGLRGFAGVGRRTLAVAAAERLGLVPVELPLGQILAVGRVLQTPLEVLQDTLLAGLKHMTASDLFLVRDAELLSMLPLVQQRAVLEMVGRLPHALLLADGSLETPPIPGVVYLGCPGLDNESDALVLVAAHLPEAKVEGPALRQVCKAASADESGILPGRLLFLVRVALSSSGASAVITDDGVGPAETGDVRPSGSIAPDEANQAVEWTADAWRRPGDNGAAED